ncbi:MAG: glycosyltransferase family 87 protein [Chloroflexota bacterium]|nr:MAG: hypothetical protein DLM70_19535 [Chloroflexota bacterium]
MGFFYYYSTSRLVVDGLGAHMYDLAVLGHVQRLLAQPYTVPQGVGPNVAPPFFVFALAPLSALPYTLSYFLWLGADCLLAAIALFHVERYSDLSKVQALLFRGTAVLSLPLLVALLQGQQSIALFSICTACFVWLRDGKRARAGAVLALMLVKPHYLPAILLVLGLRRCWRALGGFVGASATLVIAPLPFTGFAVIGDYLHTILRAGQWRDLRQSPASRIVGLRLKLRGIARRGVSRLDDLR